MRPGPKRLLRWAAIGLTAIVLLLLAGGVWLHSRLRASLPRLEGRVELEGLSAEVLVERDALGVPTLRGANRDDVARATGFLHAQDRFFQMDLLRRAAAGELAELLGPFALDFDRRTRVHRFRAAAERGLARADPAQRRILESYTDGVNAGLAALGAAPPEYLLLRVDPAAWRPEDGLLVTLAMYLDLQSDLAGRESDRGVLYEVLPRPLAEFLTPRGTEWDAPLTGEPWSTPPVPPAEVFDLRERAPTETTRASAHPTPRWADPDEPPSAGSNNWAVTGALTADGGALVANDMHLPLRLPNIWYRASFVWPDGDRPERMQRVTGLTLPGAPPIVAGSNGRIAWGFTNSQGDWADLVVLEVDPAKPRVYATPQGPREMEAFAERIAVRGAEAETLEVLWTIWGPVVDEDLRGRPRALRWVAHDDEAVDLGLLEMERAEGLDEALAAAAATRIPTQNCVVADATGRIGWTLMGPIPRRFGHDGRLPRSWAGGDAGWDGLLAPEEYPRIVDPPGGRIWTANNRVVDGEMLRVIGDGGLVLGARARQIRDDLRGIERATPRDMLAVQLDDRALLLERWRDLLLDVLAGDADPRRAELRRIVEADWTGRASIDSAGFRMVRTFRLYLAEGVLGAITAECSEADERFSLWNEGQWEGPLWRIVQERPPHLLEPGFDGWDARFLATVDRVIEYFAPEAGARLATRTWGQRNTASIRHPLSAALPSWLGSRLDAPHDPLPGDGGMPRVQSPSFGASERFVVSPGREQTGILHMPGGQSGHFLSPYYLAGHEAWARGEPTPFLPGTTLHRLTLAPPG